MTSSSDRRRFVDFGRRSFEHVNLVVIRDSERLPANEQKSGVQIQLITTKTTLQHTGMHTHTHTRQYSTCSATATAANRSAASGSVRQAAAAQQLSNRGTRPENKKTPNDASIQPQEQVQHTARRNGQSRTPLELERLTLGGKYGVASACHLTA